MSVSRLVRAILNCCFHSCLLSAVLALNGCSANVSPPSALERQENVIILVPGFKGTELATETNQVVWISAGEAVFGDASLALPNAAAGVINQKLYPRNVLHRVSIFPGLSSYDVYDTFLSRLQKDFPASKIVEFGYDWRTDTSVQAIALSSLIEEERSHGAKSISLIGHSMGGLIVSYYLRYGAQNAETAAENWAGAERVERVVIAGAPFLGALDILHDIQTGDTTGWNSELLSAEALSSFPSSYQLLPALPEGAVEGRSLDIFSADLWEENHWGLLKDRKPEQLTAARSFTAEQLLQARRLLALRHSTMSMPARTNIPLKVLNIVGQGERTPAQFKWNEEEQSIDLESTTSDDGDSVVTIRSASLPYAYGIALDSQTIEVTASHAELLAEKRAYEALKNLIKSATEIQR